MHTLTQMPYMCINALLHAYIGTQTNTVYAYTQTHQNQQICSYSSLPIKGTGLSTRPRRRRNLSQLLLTGTPASALRESWESSSGLLQQEWQKEEPMHRWTMGLADRHASFNGWTATIPLFIAHRHASHTLFTGTLASWFDRHHTITFLRGSSKATPHTWDFTDTHKLHITHTYKHTNIQMHSHSTEPNKKAYIRAQTYTNRHTHTHTYKLHWLQLRPCDPWGCHCRWGGLQICASCVRECVWESMWMCLWVCIWTCEWMERVCHIMYLWTCSSLALKQQHQGMTKV